ncbi:MAG: DUF3618 domain-containing protein [Solirubrobacteraceae bacterium]
MTGDGESTQKSPEELREEIEQTRQELGDTVEALAEKTDVKAQARDRVTAVKESALHKKDEFVSRAKEATPESASSGAQQVVSTIKRDPVPFTAIAVFAAGLLVGWLIGRR